MGTEIHINSGKYHKVHVTETIGSLSMELVPKKYHELLEIPTVEMGSVVFKEYAEPH